MLICVCVAAYLCLCGWRRGRGTRDWEKWLPNGSEIRRFKVKSGNFKHIYAFVLLALTFIWDVGTTLLPGVSEEAVV